MNEKDQADLEWLKRRQETLQMQLARLTVDIEQLASRLNAPTVAPEITPLNISPLETAATRVATEEVQPEITSHATVLPPPLPPVIAESVVPAVSVAENVLREEPPSLVPPPIPPPVPAERETFEMKLGTYWLVRVGIVMLLTGLVFLGTYAYKNYIGKLGPAGKVTLLYAASAGLLGFGGWLQRKRVKESLQNYGQVLFAGGLAAVYFTTYAAHYLPTLRIIASPLIDALLLLGWAAVTVWIADRRKSEVLALFAVGLAYYTSASAHVGLAYSTSTNIYSGLFTLASNLVLTATAVFFLVRNRWTTLSFISVLATYVGFAFWRFYNGDWTWTARTTGLWHGNFFLAGYWLCFTAAVFFARGKSLANTSRALFASLNNAAFFGLVLLSMMYVSRGHFWQFSLGFGAMLLIAALAARQFLADEPVVKNAYLVQGLTLVTLGFIAHFVGLKLALILAAESVVLTFLGQQQKNVFVRAGGYVTAALSALWVLTTMSGSNENVIIGIVIGSALLLNTWWENRHDEHRVASVVRPLSGYFVALAIGVFWIVTWHAVPGPWRAMAWLIEAILFTALFYVIRVPELPIFSQALALTAQIHWFYQFALRQNPPHWSIPATLIGGTLALTYLGHQQKNIVVRASGYMTAALGTVWTLTRMTDSHLDVTLAAIMSVALLLSAWWEQRHDTQRAISVVRPCSGYFVVLAIAVCGILTWHAVSEQWRAVAWMIEALAFTAFFYVVRIPELPLFSQALALAAQGYWFFEFALRQGNKSHWLVPATLVSGTLALSHWWQRQSRLGLLTDLRNVLQIVYGLGLVGVLFFWFQPNFAPAAWLAFLCVLAIGLTIYGVATRAWALAACAQLFLLISSAELVQQFVTTKPTWSFALVPIATWLALGIATTAWLSRHDAREQVQRSLLQVSVFYRGVAFLMSLWWIHTYVRVPNQFWVLCAIGIALIALAGWRKNREVLLFSALFLVVAFAAWLTRVSFDPNIATWTNALALLSILATQQFFRRWPGQLALPPHTHSAVIFITGLALFAFVSRWVVVTSGAHFLLTVSWAGLAALLFTLGFLLRERMHRWLGLGILAFSVGRVFLSDVWKLETIYRILSFMALGVVLLALGFIYNKYQEKIRQWL